MNELAPTNIFDIPGCQFSQTGLVIERGLALDQWGRLGAMLREVERATQWWIGDWLLYGEQEYGERCYQVIEEKTGYDHETIKQAAWVADRFPPVTRVTELSFTHHRTVASFKDPKERSKLLERAKRDHLSCRELGGIAKSHSEPASKQAPSRPALKEAPRQPLAKPDSKSPIREVQSFIQNVNQRGGVLSLTAKMGQPEQFTLRDSLQWCGEQLISFASDLSDSLDDMRDASNF